ncbi:MAG: hypothetical protein IKW98_08330 [Prevotella sp.]|nr:hypothetical protein [Prevotella sp.]
MNKQKNTTKKPTNTTRKVLTILVCVLAVACLLIFFKPVKNEDVYVLKAKSLHDTKVTLRTAKEMMGQEISEKEKCGSECPICHRLRWRVKRKLGI